MPRYTFTLFPLLLRVALAAQGEQDNDSDQPQDPVPPSPAPHPPIERHPSNDDWGTTYLAIALMTLIAFAALGILVRRSFQLVPTGVMALREFVGGRSNDGYHALAGEDSEDEERILGIGEEVAAQEDNEDAHAVRFESTLATIAAAGNGDSYLHGEREQRNSESSGRSTQL
ncbi:hypothetical protein GGI15_003111 [Coemansia interrupta]|uniref:Uncharacterized protein n=1 Tax=Coemansia interrupta TaxID=1126814 RepID=A0A9W8H946_9FUNG|nr:hypothetical protein GGI15_003111 [Coemansia interrupta]